MPADVPSDHLRARATLDGSSKSVPDLRRVCISGQLPLVVRDWMQLGLDGATVRSVGSGRSGIALAIISKIWRRGTELGSRAASVSTY